MKILFSPSWRKEMLFERTYNDALRDSDTDPENLLVIDESDEEQEQTPLVTHRYPVIDHTLEKECRFCHITNNQELIAPCACGGTMAWVHRYCLNKWRFSGAAYSISRCPTCLQHYKYTFAKENIGNCLFRILTVAAIYYFYAIAIFESTVIVMGVLLSPQSKHLPTVIVNAISNSVVVGILILLGFGAIFSCIFVFTTPEILGKIPPDVHSLLRKIIIGFTWTTSLNATISVLIDKINAKEILNSIGLSCLVLFLLCIPIIVAVIRLIDILHKKLFIVQDLSPLGTQPEPNNTVSYYSIDNICDHHTGQYDGDIVYRT